MARDLGGVIGRERELAELATLLGEHPVVGLVGAVGIGKTAVALALLDGEHRARRLPPPARLSIAGADDERALFERTAHALGREAPSSAPGLLGVTLRRMLAVAPRALAWDDAQEAAPAAVGALVGALGLAKSGPSRLLIVSRAPIAGLDVPSLTLPPLAPDACAALVEELERERGLTLSEALASRAAGNPLAIRLALAALDDAAALDPVAALRRLIAELCREGARPVLAMLSSLDRPASQTELVRLFPDARAVLDRLGRSGLLVARDGHVDFPPAIASLVRAQLGELSHESWELLGDRAERALAAAAADGDALLLACRSLGKRGQAARAVALLWRHVLARHAVSTQALDELVRALGAADPAYAGELGLILAGEELRRGDVAAALRTLDGVDGAALAPELGTRLDVIRARALARTGGLATARGRLERTAGRSPAAGHDQALQITAAAVTLLRGELAAGRAALAAITPDAAQPRLSCDRALAFALSYFLEERFARAAGWARRARRHLGRARVRRSIVGAIEVLGLLGLDLIDRAVALLDEEEPPGDGDGTLAGDLAHLYTAAVLGRRGQLDACLDTAEPAFDELGRRGDFACRAILARYLARAALGLGRFERAEELLRIAGGVASEGGLVSLLPLVRRDEALLADATGDRAAAAALAQEAAAGCPGSPLVRIDAWALGSDEPPPRVAGAPAHAYLQLRSAERDLARGEAALALEPARAAEQHYRRAGAQLERAQALVALAEAATRVGLYDEARAALATGEAVARPRGYAPLLGAFAVVRASLADRTGALGAYVDALADAAATAPAGDRLAAARARLGLRTATGATTALDARVARLALDRPAARLLATESETWLLAADEPLPTDARLVVDVDRKALRAGARVLPLTAQRLALLEFLCTVGGATLEAIYLGVLGGREYHPLRHRSTVYVAINRLRAALDPLVGADAIVERAAGRYRLRADLGAAVLCSADAIPPSSGLAARLAAAGVALGR